MCEASIGRTVRGPRPQVEIDGSDYSVLKATHITFGVHLAAAVETHWSRSCEALSARADEERNLVSFPGDPCCSLVVAVDKQEILFGSKAKKVP